MGKKPKKKFKQPIAEVEPVNKLSSGEMGLEVTIPVDKLPENETMLVARSGTDIFISKPITQPQPQPQGKRSFLQRMRDRRGK